MYMYMHMYVNMNLYMYIAKLICTEETYLGTYWNTYRTQKLIPTEAARLRGLIAAAAAPRAARRASRARAPNEGAAPKAGGLGGEVRPADGAHLSLWAQCPAGGGCWANPIKHIVNPAPPLGRIAPGASRPLEVLYLTAKRQQPLRGGMRILSVMGNLPD